jgi:hypothetical protein
MTEARVISICAEYGIEIVDGRAYPGIRQTRAVVTMERILRKNGEDHFRMVMSTIAETENNQGQIDEYLLWAVSDLVRAATALSKKGPRNGFECFDAPPVEQLQFIARDLCGITHQRHALAGMHPRG